MGTSDSPSPYRPCGLGEDIVSCRLYGWRSAITSLPANGTVEPPPPLDVKCRPDPRGDTVTDHLLNLSDDHFVKLSVALVLPESEIPAAGGGEAATPPEGYGALPQEAAVRAVITDTVTDASAKDLTNRKRREALRVQVLKAIKAHTDVKANDVLFTDVAVQ